ncbi:MAG: nucleotidyltransferase domain-containing protein [Gammaproteobacteria bacterium]|nr:nucleotidyltransferase domain-containing protein [Gammaproteobacteria bacterium]MCY4211940.1 nucleotidyltransferase domain-containing protein [Gammaproteobacteria bacterium]
MNLHVTIPESKALTAFCLENGIIKLAVFGSALCKDFNAESDIDLLVKFRPEAAADLFKMAGIEIALSPLFGGRSIDLRTLEELSPYLRGRVLNDAILLVDIAASEDEGSKVRHDHSSTADVITHVHH